MAARLSRPEIAQDSHKCRPNYWASDPQSLNTECHVNSIAFGNGLSIYQSCITPRLLAAEDEVLLVTCFWARSETLAVLNDGLRRLSAKAVQQGKRIRVRICFSSSSLFQKLFHTSSTRGHTYGASKCASSLGLSGEAEMPGLDVQVKSIFILPFSVMHPKFVVIDRQRVLLPSCNVSWESWFEGCIDLQGPVVGQFVTFWQDFWANDDDRGPLSPTPSNPSSSSDTPHTSCLLGSQTLGLRQVSCTFLPSPHHRNPRFTFPWTSRPQPPPTPLNIYLLALFAKAETSIYIQTPNLTSPPVLEALLQSLRRGVSVSITTSERLMVLEQLVTAGTTTKRCVTWLIKRYRQLLEPRGSIDPAALEAGNAPKSIGALQIRFYEPRPDSGSDLPEPVQSHFKFTTVDGKIMVLGSGNLDRASWFTSQELGVAFVSSALVEATMTTLGAAMTGRSKLFYNNGGR